MPRVIANLTRFVELALEVDAGRYPTLPRFLDKLGQLRSLDKEGPSQATPRNEGGQRVRILTVHASKGLEAPIVFIADAAAVSSGSNTCQTLVSWPAESDRPTDFMLLSNSQARDQISDERYQHDLQEEQRESANLLYVALTRARNMLVISGCSSNRQASLSSWHASLSRALCDSDTVESTFTESYLEPPQRDIAPPAGTEPVDVDIRLSQPLPVTGSIREIAPSRQVDALEASAGDGDGIIRGLFIHRLLQLTLDSGFNEGLIVQVAAEQGLAPNDTRIADWRDEVYALLNDTRLAWLMRPDAQHRAYNEVPLSYRRNRQTVYGLIDRLLVGPERIWIVDYKSHRIRHATDRARLAAHYSGQLDMYRDGVKQLWPRHQLTSCLLLTHTAEILEVS